MNDLKLIAVAFAGIAMIAIITTPQATLAENASGSASVEIRQPVAVSQATPLAFGLVSADNADILTMDPDGSISALNGATISAGSANPGAFTAAGTANTTVIITFTDGTLSGAGADMALTGLTHDGGALPNFDATGALSFSVGADLVIGAAQTPGTYTGTYEVSVNYQ